MKRDNWWNNYIGIPYLEKGRDRNGIDCWGLVRLVHSEQYGIELPSLAGDYDSVQDRKHLAEIVAREREGWQKVNVPREGDVAVFRILGSDSHVGICTAPGEFLHVREGQSAVIERFASAVWKNRLEGVYRYCAKDTPIEVSAAAHPLKTERIEGLIPAGRTIAQTIEHLKMQQGVSPELPYHATVWVNGKEVAQDDWERTIPAPGSRVEVRAVARGSAAGRIIGMIAVMIVAWYLAPFVAGAALGVPATLVNATAIGVAQTALTMAGSLLVNAIFPVRPPEASSLGTPEQQRLLQGGSNQANPYGAVPVVLGRFRYTAPIGANTYVENDATDSFLRMAVVWGHGPLQVSDIRLGNVSIDTYEEVEIETVEGTSGEDMDRFNQLYGRDVEQISPQIELTCPGLDVTSASRTSGVVTVNTSGAHNYSSGMYAWLTGQMYLAGEVTVVDSNTFTIPFASELVGPELAELSTYQRDGTIGWTATYNAYGPALQSFEASGGPKTAIVSSVGTPWGTGPWDLVSGVQYRVTFRLIGTGGTGKVYPSVTTTLGSTSTMGTGFAQVADGVYTAIVTAPASGEIGIYADPEWTGTVCQISCKAYYYAGEDAVVQVDRTRASAWHEYSIVEETDRLNVSLHFPTGLQQSAIEGSNAGQIDSTSFRGQIQVRQLDSDTLVPITGWGEIVDKIPATRVRLPTAYYNIDSDAALEPVYQWHRFSIDEYGKVIVRAGALTQSQNSNPSGNLLRRLQEDNFGFNITFERLPTIPAGEELLYDICVYGDDVVQSSRKADSTVTGCTLTSSTGRTIVLTSGTIWRAETETVKLGGSGEPFYKRKDAFTHNVSFNVARGVYQVRVRRTNESNDDFEYPSGNAGRRTHTCFLQSITAYSSRRPITPPKPLAMSAIRIKATDQINGQVAGVTATVQSICKDYNHTTGTWVSRPTRNPASLLRYVLQHPANAKRVADSAIDIAALEDFHNYCRTNGFTYDNVITDQRSLWDVLLDIAAAGRASPTLRDGKWTVVIDKPRTSIAQHFTPHNSWGFEGVRALPKLPHGFRVQFNNARRGYQPDEMIVYNDGYTAANATLFEGISLPGVTEPSIVFKHARFHLAQTRLRPETYTLNADIEHLVCMRGDLVRVTHDVPMWGLGTGRIKERVSGTEIELDEAVPMDAGVQYTIRIRSASGASVVRTVAAKGADGYYTSITLTSSVTTAQCAPGDLFMFGALSEESVELVVQSVEPSTNMTARLTLVDYAPAVYDSDSEVIPAWDSQITKPPKLQQRVITQKPTVTQIKSDESVMLRTPSGGYDYGLRLSWRNPDNLPGRVNGVQAEIDIYNDGKQRWSDVQSVPLKAKSVTFRGLREGETYVVRLRYVDREGRVGQWQTSSPHTVVGKTTPPKQVTGLSVTPNGRRLLLDWNSNEEIDVNLYEVRTTNSGWGTAGYVYRGRGTSVLVDPPATAGSSTTWYVKARDAARLYSTNAASVAYTRAAPAAPGTITASVSDTSTTTARITFNWPDANPTFGLNHYKISLALPDSSVRTATIKASEWTTNYNWTGDATLSVSVVDSRGLEGPARTLVRSKVVPNQVGVVSTSISGNKLFLNWPNLAKTSLPIAGYEIRHSNADWGEPGYIYRGTSSQYLMAAEVLATGDNTFWIKAFDTDGRYSTSARSVSYNKSSVSAPGTFVVTFSDTASTDATVSVNWADSTSPFGIAYYQVTVTRPAPAAVQSFKTRASEITLRANWVGSTTVQVQARDQAGFQSAVGSTTITKSVPATVGTVTKTVVRGNIKLDWPDVAKTTLPVAGYEVRTANSGWGTAGYKYRGASSVTPNIRMATGANTYYVRAFDTDGNYSAAAAAVSHTWDVPPTASALTLSLKRGQIKMVSSFASIPTDMQRVEYRIKRGVTTGDVWTAYDDVETAQSTVAYWTPTQLGTYRVAVRMIDKDGNVSASSVLANITINKVPAP